MPKEDKKYQNKTMEKSLLKFHLLLMLIWSVCLKG